MEWINFDGKEDRAWIGKIELLGWHHVVLIKEEITKIYVDGVQLKDGDVIEDKSGNDHHGVFHR